MIALAPTRAKKSIVDGEFTMTAADFECIARLIYADAGIVLSENKTLLAYSRVAKRVRTLQMTNFAEYCEFVQSPEGTDERGHLLTALTTNVTRFFRESHHFEHLAANILPRALEVARGGGRVRLWSSACSSGQEPYSIALTVLRLCPEAPKLDIRILATDVDANMLEIGRRGAYETQLANDIPIDLRRRWLEPTEGVPGMLSMSEPVRSLVEFRSLNLIRSWPMRGKFQAIFCRNVMIYFDLPTQSQIWARMTPLLTLGAALYIGHSERVAGPAAQDLQLEGVTTYRLVNAGGQRPPA